MLELMFLSSGEYIVRTFSRLLTIRHDAMPQVTLNKLEGAKTVVVGGLNDAPQHYAGSIGGQNIDFFFLDRS